MRNLAKPGEKGTTAQASELLYYDDLPSKVKEQIVTHSDISLILLNYILSYNTVQIKRWHILLQFQKNY